MSRKWLLAPVVLSGLVGAAFVSREADPPGSQMVSAAEELVGSLTPEQKAKGVFAFDDKERTNWHFVPLQDKAKKSTRKGLPLEEMTAEQKQAARKQNLKSVEELNQEEFPKLKKGITSANLCSMHYSLKLRIHCLNLKCLHWISSASAARILFDEHLKSQNLRKTISGN